MTKNQTIISISAVVLAILLFQLPRSVVENDQIQDVEETALHSLEIPQKIKNKIIKIKKIIEKEKKSNKKIIFAYSLANHYLDYGVVDSATRYADLIESLGSSSLDKVADIYFRAFEVSSEPDKVKEYASKANIFLRQLLNKDSKNLELKNKLAMTLVVSDNPMVGVSMLRDILVEEKTNRQAILNLGLLAIQSGQFEKARGRFEKLVSLNREDYEAKLYLAVSMMEINEPIQARLLLNEIIVAQDSIPAIKVMANDYLSRL